MEDGDAVTWFHDESFDESAFVKLDPDLTDRVFDKVKDTPLDTTEKTVAYLNKQYPGEDWADRSPKTLPSLWQLNVLVCLTGLSFSVQV